MPIMAVVVPKLKSTRLGWQLEGGRHAAALRGATLVAPCRAVPRQLGAAAIAPVLVLLSSGWLAG